jgi:DNA-directed RNA polymerase specialized sigma24 family protein
MDLPPGELVELLRRARDGDHEAARQIVERYSTILRPIIRRRLDERLHSAYDSVDILQSVWRDFFLKEQFKQAFESPENLLAFLREMSFNKVRQVHRNNLGTQKRGRSRQIDLPDDLTDPLPPPDQAAAERDDWDAKLRELPPQWRRALIMLREGHTQAEVARFLGIHERTRERFLARARQGQAGPDTRLR